MRVLGLIVSLSPYLRSALGGDPYYKTFDEKYDENHDENYVENYD